MRSVYLLALILPPGYVESPMPPGPFMSAAFTEATSNEGGACDWENAFPFTRKRPQSAAKTKMVLIKPSLLPRMRRILLHWSFRYYITNPGRAFRLSNRGDGNLCAGLALEYLRVGGW